MTVEGIGLMIQDAALGVASFAVLVAAAAIVLMGFLWGGKMLVTTFKAFAVGSELAQMKADHEAMAAVDDPAGLGSYGDEEWDAGAAYDDHLDGVTAADFADDPDEEARYMQSMDAPSYPPKYDAADASELGGDYSFVQVDEDTYVLESDIEQYRAAKKFYG